MSDKGEKDVRLMAKDEFFYNRSSLKHKLVAAVSNGEELAARELRFLLKIEKPESLRGSPLKR
jgi:hypothetical protein